MDPFIGTFDRRIGTITMRQEDSGNMDVFTVEKFIQIRIAFDVKIVAETSNQCLIFVKCCDDLGLWAVFEQRHVPSWMQVAETNDGDFERLGVHLTLSYVAKFV